MSNVCLPDPVPKTWCGVPPHPSAIVIVIIVFVAAGIPLGLIAAGMAPVEALATAGATVAFAFGVTHQILNLLAGYTRPSGLPGEAAAARS
jgi:hypothetical protein